MSEADRKELALPILREFTRQIGVANGGTRKWRRVTQLPFQQLSKKVAEADTFNKFKTSLMSVGRIADDDNISVFTAEDVKVFKEKDSLIICKGEPILIGK